LGQHGAAGLVGQLARAEYVTDMSTTNLTFRVCCAS
jgi:hypothetical protein